MAYSCRINIQTLFRSKWTAYTPKFQRINEEQINKSAIENSSRIK